MPDEVVLDLGLHIYWNGPFVYVSYGGFPSLRARVVAIGELSN